jgi:hypothetical protein
MDVELYLNHLLTYAKFWHNTTVSVIKGEVLRTEGKRFVNVGIRISYITNRMEMMR